jgi:acetylornithine/succinyldiaminopimelate/putrescine aminotransferase
VARRALLEQRLIVNATGPTTLRLLPPLTIGADDAEEAVRRLARALSATAAG